MEILVVEDEKKTARSIKLGLEDDNYSVTVASDGDEGFKLAMSGEFNLLILDVTIPKKNGLTVTKELREYGSQTPILLLNALGTTEAIVSGLDAGADDYLIKPIAIAELRARVKALLRRSYQNRGADINFADLRLDPVSHKVWRSGTEIILTDKAYDLLEYLVRNANKIVTRTMLAEHIWSPTLNPFSNVIDVYINYLRRKVDSGYPSKLIHTIRKQGYSLREG